MICRWIAFNPSKFSRILSLFSSLSFTKPSSSATKLDDEPLSAFYTGVIGAAVTEQLYKEKFWEEHPGKAVPLMKPLFYRGPWRVYRGEAIASDASSSSQ